MYPLPARENFAENVALSVTGREITQVDLRMSLPVLDWCYFAYVLVDQIILVIIIYVIK